MRALFSPDSAPETFDSSMNLLSQIKYLVRVQRVSPSILAVSQHTESIREEYKMIVYQDRRGKTTRRYRIVTEGRGGRSNVCRHRNRLNATEVRAVTFPKSKNRIRAKIHYMNLFVNINKVLSTLYRWNPEKYYKIEWKSIIMQEQPTDRGFQ